MNSPSEVKEPQTSSSSTKTDLVPDSSGSEPETAETVENRRRRTPIDMIDRALKPQRHRWDLDKSIACDLYDYESIQVALADYTLKRESHIISDSEVYSALGPFDPKYIYQLFERLRAMARPARRSAISSKDSTNRAGSSEPSGSGPDSERKWLSPLDYRSMESTRKGRGLRLPSLSPLFELQAFADRCMSS